MRKSHSLKLKSISGLLALAFFASDISYAAPALVFAPKDIIQTPALLEIPESLARFREAHKGQNKLIIHIQDAHTNPSAQKNIAKLLEGLVQKYGLKTVFLEGGTKDDSLDFLRPLADAKTREQVANKFLMQGELNGAEYLNLSSNLDFKLLGVEDASLYQKNLKHYAQLFQKREAVLSYIEEAQSAVNTLKYQLFPKELIPLDEAIQKLEKKDKDFTQHHALLLTQAQKSGVNLLGYPNFLTLKDIKQKEDKINFDKANKEQEKLVSELAGMRVSGDDLAHPQTRTLADQSFTPLQRLKSDGVTPLPLYEEFLKQALHQKLDIQKYPNLLLYVDYLRTYSSLDLEKFFKETQAIEEEIYQKALSSHDALYLHQIDNHLKLVKKLFLLQSSSDEFSKYQENKKDISFETIVYLAFLNKTLYDLGRYSEVVRYLPLIDENRAEAEDFYETNKKRDEVFLKKALKYMDRGSQDRGIADKKSFFRHPPSAIHDPRIAVLITGGYHTENLKELMKKEGISYAIVTPLISEETNIPRYEQILLNQLGKESPVKKTVTVNADSLNVELDAEQARFASFQTMTDAMNAEGNRILYEGDIFKAQSAEEIAQAVASATSSGDGASLGSGPTASKLKQTLKMQRQPITSTWSLLPSLIPGLNQDAANKKNNAKPPQQRLGPQIEAGKELTGQPNGEDSLTKVGKDLRDHLSTTSAQNLHTTRVYQTLSPQSRTSATPQYALAAARLARAPAARAGSEPSSAIDHRPSTTALSAPSSASRLAQVDLTLSGRARVPEHANWLLADFTGFVAAIQNIEPDEIERVRKPSPGIESQIIWIFQRTDTLKKIAAVRSRLSTSWPNLHIALTIKSEIDRVNENISPYVARYDEVTNTIILTVTEKLFERDRGFEVDTLSFLILEALLEPNSDRHFDDIDAEILTPVYGLAQLAPAIYAGKQYARLSAELLGDGGHSASARLAGNNELKSSKVQRSEGNDPFSTFQPVNLLTGAKGANAARLASVKDIQKALQVAGESEIQSGGNRIDALSPAQIKALWPGQIKALWPGQIKALLPYQIKALLPAQIKALSPAQIKALSPYQITALLPDQINALSPAQIKALSPYQITALSRDQITALSPDQITALSPDQIKALSADHLQTLLDRAISLKMRKGARLAEYNGLKGSKVQRSEGNDPFSTFQPVNFLTDAAGVNAARLADVAVVKEKPVDTLTLSGHEDQVRSVSFSPDGKRIASASGDHTIKVWPLEGLLTAARLAGIGHEPLRGKDEVLKFLTRYGITAVVENPYKSVLTPLESAIAQDAQTAYDLDGYQVIYQKGAFTAYRVTQTPGYPATQPLKHMVFIGQVGVASLITYASFIPELQNLRFSLYKFPDVGGSVYRLVALFPDAGKNQALLAIFKLTDTGLVMLGDAMGIAVDFKSVRVGENGTIRFKIPAGLPRTLNAVNNELSALRDQSPEGARLARHQSIGGLLALQTATRSLAQSAKRGPVAESLRGRATVISSPSTALGVNSASVAISHAEIASSRHEGGTRNDTRGARLAVSVKRSFQLPEGNRYEIEIRGVYVNVGGSKVVLKDTFTATLKELPSQRVILGSQLLPPITKSGLDVARILSKAIEANPESINAVNELGVFMIHSIAAATRLAATSELARSAESGTSLGGDRLRERSAAARLAENPSSRVSEASVAISRGIASLSPTVTPRKDEEISSIAARLAASTSQPANSVRNVPFLQDQVFNLEFVRTASAAETRVNISVIPDVRNPGNQVPVSSTTLNRLNAREALSKTLRVSGAAISSTKLSEAQTQKLASNNFAFDLLAQIPGLRALPSFRKSPNTWNTIFSGLPDRSGLAKSSGLRTGLALPYLDNEVDLERTLELLKTLAISRKLQFTVLFTHRGEALSLQALERLKMFSDKYAGRVQILFTELGNSQELFAGVLEAFHRENISSKDLEHLVVGVSSADFSEDTRRGFEKAQRELENSHVQIFGVGTPADTKTQLILLSDEVQTALATLVFPGLTFPSSISFRAHRVYVKALGIEILMIEPVLERELSAAELSRESSAKAA